jgi:hypothetical protein
MSNSQPQSTEKQQVILTDPYKEQELLLKEREVNIKELEVNAQIEINRRNRWSTSPLLIGIVSVVFGSLGTALLQGYWNNQLERQKFEFNLISRALEGKDKNILLSSNNKEAAKKLSFLVKLGLIKTLDPNLIKQLAQDPEKLPDFSIEPRQENSVFSCQIVGGTPTTVAAHSIRGKVVLIKWMATDYPSGLSAKDQCEKVSSRFQQSNENGMLNFITTKVENGKGFICATKTKKGICDFELFEVPSSIDPKSIVEGIYKLNSSVNADAIQQ